MTFLYNYFVAKGSLFYIFIIMADANVQIVLNIKEGSGFGIFNAPFLVSASLNSQKLESDPVAPCTNPLFECELVWELKKKYLTNLRLHNVPIKVEVCTISLRGHKERVGYMVLSLPFCQPSAPSRSAISSWHKLLGVQGQGKNISPQILLSLSVEDRKDLALMATEATVCNGSARSAANHAIAFSELSASAGDMTPTANFSGRKPYVYHESHPFENSKPLPPDLVPMHCYDEGIIQIGPSDCNTNFLLSFFIKSAENVDLLISDKTADMTNAQFYINYSIFSYTVKTERYTLSTTKMSDDTMVKNIQFNQRSSFKLCSNLVSLSKYFMCCPYVMVKLFQDNLPLALSNIDIRKIVPTEDLDVFLNNFCNNEKILSYVQRCHLISCATGEVPRTASERQPFIDIRIDLKCIPDSSDFSLNVADVPTPLTFSDHQCKAKDKLKSAAAAREMVDILDFTPITENANEGDMQKLCKIEKGPFEQPEHIFTTEARKDAGDNALHAPADIQELLKDNHSNSHHSHENHCSFLTEVRTNVTPDALKSNMAVKNKSSSSNTAPQSPLAKKNDSKYTQSVITSFNKDCAAATDDLPVSLQPEKEHQLVKRIIEELEEWKERQQELFKTQLKCKEDRCLEMLSLKWTEKRTELEEKLKKGVNQCKQLTIDLTAAKDELRLRDCDIQERDKRLSKAKEELETLYNNKYQDLRFASKQLEEEYRYNLKASEQKRVEQEEHLKMVGIENADLKEKLINVVREMDKIKRTALNKDQTADLLQELRVMEEKMEAAERAKQFFKEQWTKAIHEIHLYKMQNRSQMHEQLQGDRQHIDQISLEQMINNEQMLLKERKTDLKKLKDDMLQVNLSTSSLGSQNEMRSTST